MPSWRDWLRPTSDFKIHIYYSSLLSSTSVPPEAILSQRLLENPYFPFTYTGQGAALELTVRYEGFYLAILVFLVSSGVAVAWIATDYVSNGFFPLAVMTMIVAMAVMYHFRIIRRYTLYPNDYQYEYASGDQVHVHGDFSNIYIRLHREALESLYRQRTYYLVLNGFEMDRLPLCAPTPNLDELRQIGQRIASNLNLNYFDEANISKHHVIRHFRNDRGVFSFRERGQIDSEQ
ncbi:hypothetical protein BC831DRAFT_481121 [Entophlyctis helioformis]|nr:hypothetical protein BC831DRAFT_481121 [Entophlyctis helioformis]